MHQLPKICLSLAALTATASLLALAATAPAQALAYTVTNASSKFLGNPSYTLGFEFTATSPQTVMVLGLFDGSQNSLVDSYAVGLFAGGSSLLALGGLAMAARRKKTAGNMAGTNIAWVLSPRHRQKTARGNDPVAVSLWLVSLIRGDRVETRDG